MLFGLDYLGGSNYGDLILREHPAGWAAGFMLTTNDPQWPKHRAWPVIRKLLASGKCPVVRVHAVWRDSHGYVPRRDDPIIMRQLKRAMRIQALFPNTKILFSPFCEHNIKGRQLTRLFDRLREISTLELVNSVYLGDLLPNVTNEVHGTKPPPRRMQYIYSFDGTNAFEHNVRAMQRKHQKADIFFLWSPQLNGRAFTHDKTPRDKRRAWPDADHLRKLIGLAI